MSNFIHESFKLNGVSFTSSTELLEFTKDSLSCIFLRQWFSTESTVEVNTSGSTGVPKKITLSKELMINSARATGSYFRVGAGTTVLLCLSTDYIAGKMMLVRALVLGWELDIVTSTSVVCISKDYDFSAMVPLQLRNSLDSIHRIKTLIVGGGVVANDLLEKIKNIKTQVFATYGMTETITHIAVKKLNNCSNFESRYYQILSDVKIYIDNRNCLIIDAPKISKSIVKTNDVVSLVSDKHFEWLGRYDNVINSGGVKLYPEKIEDKLSDIISKRFFVAGVEDNKLGQKLVLVIESRPYDISLNTSALTKFEYPKQIYFYENFIETETKKIQRRSILNLLLS